MINKEQILEEARKAEKARLLVPDDVTDEMYHGELKGAFYVYKRKDPYCIEHGEKAQSWKDTKGTLCYVEVSAEKKNGHRTIRVSPIGKGDIVEYECWAITAYSNKQKYYPAGLADGEELLLEVCPEEQDGPAHLS